MKVHELILFLLDQPQDLDVAYECYSEQRLLEKHEIQIVVGCEPRNDGWIENPRPDKPAKKYLMFPGN